MRIFLILCILIGILIPTCVIYVDQQPNAPIIQAKSISTVIPNAPATPIATPSAPFYYPTPTPTIEPLVEIVNIIEVLPTPVCPRPEYQGEAWSCTQTNLLKPDGSYIVQCRYGTAMPLQNRAEVEQFMRWDTTNLNPVGEFYNCASYTDDVCQNASKHEIQCYPVVLWFADGKIHSIVVFPTVENGDVFIDVTQGDWWATLGQQYQAINFDDPNYSFYGTKEKIIARTQIYY